MTYRLKDTELQKKLDSFTDGEFSDKLRDDALVGKKFVAVVCGEPVPGVDARISPDEPEERPARRLSFLFSKDEVEEVPTRPSEVMKAEAMRRIECLRGSLDRIERSLREDELMRSTFGGGSQRRSSSKSSAISSTTIWPKQDTRRRNEDHRRHPLGALEILRQRVRPSLPRLSVRRSQRLSKLAEVARDYLAKGKQVYIEGRLRTRKFTDKDGAEKYVTEIICETLKLLGRKDDGAQAPAPAPARSTPASTPSYTDDDVPF